MRKNMGVIDRAKSVRRGNIVSTEWSGERKIGSYLGNGRFGAILSGLGLNLNPNQAKDSPHTASHFNHTSHWGRFHFFSRHMNAESTVDYILPFFTLFWENEFSGITQYRQCHDLYDGILTTDFKQESGASAHIVTWFDCIDKDLAGVLIDTEGCEVFPNRICLSAPTLIDPCPFVCGEKYPQFIKASRSGDEWRMSVSCDGACNDSSTAVYISTDMDTEIAETGLIFQPKPGKNHLLFSVHTAVGREDPLLSLERTKNWWHKTWEETGWIDYSDERVQQVWVRGMAYLLSSYDADCERIQPANSMGIDGFAYNFVPDMENIAPVLLMTEHRDIVKHWVELFAGEIDGMRRYAKHLWPDAEGIFPPWELNYGPIEGYHAPSVPVIYCYEAHNAGYLCRLAAEAADFAADEEWAKKYADPLIRGCAEFFRAFCHKEDDGFWHLRCFPCMGRDEAGGVNKDDYLCTLLTAKYTFQAAVRRGLDEDFEYKQILTDGFAFDGLLSERGTWRTCRGADDFGKQKHPIQLEGIACFPTEAEPLPPEAKAHELRYEITSGAKDPRFLGWTLAQFLIADTNMKNAHAWRTDWDLLRSSNNVDEDWIQFYESSGSIRSPFYLATHGMILQSLIRNCVNDYWGRLEVGSCLPEDAFVRFENIRTRLGVSVSGTIESGRFSGTITSLRNRRIDVVGDNTPITQGAMPKQKK